MTQALRMACGHEVSILSAFIDTERDSTLLSTEWCHCHRSTGCTQDCLLPPDSPHGSPLLTGHRKTLNLSHSFLWLSLLSQAIQRWVNSISTNPWLHSTLSNLNSYLQVSTEISVTFCRWCSREESSFPSHSLRLISLPPSCIYGAPNFKNNFWHLLLYILFQYNNNNNNFNMKFYIFKYS